MTGKHGGYNYGNSVGIREFELECYIDGITTEVFEQMLQWIHRDAKGRLIFDDRPFVYYDVCPWKKPEGKIYPMGNSNEGSVDSTLWGGTLTLFFKAYDPFGKMLYKSYDDYDFDGAGISSGILETSQMPPSIEAITGDYLVYNPGTETANTIIRIAGSAPNGVMIRNYTNGTACA